MAENYYRVGAQHLQALYYYGHDNVEYHFDALGQGTRPIM